VAIGLERVNVRSCRDPGGAAWRRCDAGPAWPIDGWWALRNWFVPDGRPDVPGRSLARDHPL